MNNLYHDNVLFLSVFLLSALISVVSESEGSLLLPCSPQNPNLSTCPSDADCSDLGTECLSW